jgi:integrase
MSDGTIKSIKAWPSANRGFYRDFRQWLRDGGYSDSAIRLYSIAVRRALGLLDKPYWMIDDADIERVRQYMADHVPNPATRATYRKGLAKLVEYLHHRCHRKPPPKQVNWDYYVGPLPEWLADDLRAYVAHCRRAWIPERQYRASLEIISQLTRPLRWIVARAPLADMGDLTPDLWFDYADARLAADIKPATLNRELAALQEFLRFLDAEGRPICQRTLLVERLPVGLRLPRDVPVDQLRRLMQEIEVDAGSSNAGIRRMGVMDRAWFSLMVYSALRVGEVRRLHLSDLDLEGHRVRIEQSKGLKDRVIPLSQPTVDALRAYLDVRGPAATDHVFIYRHRALGFTYCNHRLKTYGRRCGIQVTCHQLRHSAATMLLNAGAPILTVQTILGHKNIDTTRRYARLYDGTVAAHYYCAMAEVESRMGLQDVGDGFASDPAHLLALVDSLQNGTLNDDQQETVHALRTAILGLAEREVTRVAEQRI